MKKKIVALCLCIALAVVAIGGATLAYFTDTTPAVKNTFTVGKVDIDLWENEDGTTNSNKVSGRTDIKVAPGSDIKKNPTVSVTADSEDCWLFVQMDITNWPAANVTYALAEGWSILPATKGGTAADFTVGTSFVLYRTVSKADTTREFAILSDDTITVSNQLVSGNFVQDANGGMKQPSMVFTAFAIQKDNLGNVNDAWDAVKDAANP